MAFLLKTPPATLRRWPKSGTTGGSSERPAFSPPYVRPSATRLRNIGKMPFSPSGLAHAHWHWHLKARRVLSGEGG